MKRIVVLNIKGGVGKTVLADELAFSLDRTDTPYSYFDFDGQGGGTHEESLREDAIVQIADTPSAASTDDLTKWAEAADIAVIPTRSTGTDIPPLTETIETIREANPDIDIVFVQNAWNRWSLAKNFEEWLNSKAEGAPIIHVPQSELIAQAATLKKSALDVNAKSNAAKSILEYVNAVRKAAGLEPEER